MPELPKNSGINLAPPSPPRPVTVNDDDLGLAPPPPHELPGRAPPVAPPEPVPPAPRVPRAPPNPNVNRPPSPQVVSINCLNFHGRADALQCKLNSNRYIFCFLYLRTHQNTQPYSGPNGFTISGNGLGQGNPGQVGGNPGGYVIPGGGCNCCNCNGGMAGGTANGVMVPYMGTMFIPQFMMANFQSFQSGSNNAFAANALSTNSLVLASDPGCPWECVIDETVPTMGRSNEDDALYEIFYTNPLNCCGTIVEIGAGNGKQHSSSYFFEYGMNWTSVLTEADPSAFAQIADERTGKKAKLLNGAFCQEAPHVYYDEALKSFQSASSPSEYTSEVTHNDFQVSSSTTKVDCIRLDSDVLSGLDHVNVMVIKVDGDPWAVVRTMNWDVKVDIWVIKMDDKEGMLHDTLRAALKLHDYVPAAWDIKLWCETPANCVNNEVWLRKSFHPLPQPLLEMGGNLRGSLE